MEKIAGWHRSGFSVHSQVRAKTKEEAEGVCKHTTRFLLSLERFSFSQKEGKVCYRYGEGQEEPERMGHSRCIHDLTLDEISSLIPDREILRLGVRGIILWGDPG